MLQDVASDVEFPAWLSLPVPTLVYLFIYFTVIFS